nr:hypothetical protein [Hyphomonas sp.]
MTLGRCFCIRRAAGTNVALSGITQLCTLFGGIPVREVPKDLHTEFVAFLGMTLHAGNIAARESRREVAPSILGGNKDICRICTFNSVGVHEIESRLLGQVFEQGVRLLRIDEIPANVRQSRIAFDRLGAAPEMDRLCINPFEPRPPPSSLDLVISCMPRQMPRTGILSPSTRSLNSGARPRRLKLSMP